VLVLGSRGGDRLAQKASTLGSSALRHEVVDAFGGLGRLAPLAVLIHRLEPGVRVM